MQVFWYIKYKHRSVLTNITEPLYFTPRLESPVRPAGRSILIILAQIE